MAFKKILVALDGSESSEKALSLVVGMAGRFGATIHVLAVTDPGSNGSTEADAAADNIRESKASAKKYVDDIAAQWSATGVNVVGVIEEGFPADAILKTAESAGADLIALATHRGSAIARGVLGSVTDNVLRSSPVPVLAINPDQVSEANDIEWLPSTIIVPLDGSPLAEEGVQPAISIAKACGSAIIFIQAVHLPTFAVSGPGAEYYASEYGVASQRDGARRYLAQFVELAQSQGVEASTHAALGKAAARIIEETSNVKNALVVVCSHGRGGLKRMVLGSVSDKLVRASHHPVLVLKHGQGE